MLAWAFWWKTPYIVTFNIKKTNKIKICEARYTKDSSAHWQNSFGIFSICPNIFVRTWNQHIFIPLAAKQRKDWNRPNSWSWDRLLIAESVSVVSVRLESCVCLADCRHWYRDCVACNIVGVAFQSKYIAAFRTSVRLGVKKKHGTEEK